DPLALVELHAVVVVAAALVGRAAVADARGLVVAAARYTDSLGVAAVLGRLGVVEHGGILEEEATLCPSRREESAGHAAPALHTDDAAGGHLLAQAGEERI